MGGAVSKEYTEEGVEAALRVPGGIVWGPEEKEELSELLYLILCVLDLRWMEAKAAGRLLYPTARSLRVTLRHLFASLLTPAPPTGRSPGKNDSTPEQKSIINSLVTPGLTLIKAFTGTGKTTTLLRLSEAKEKIRSLRILYCASNKSLVTDAERKFIHLCTQCKTTNEIAYAHLAQRPTFFAKAKLELAPDLVVRLLGPTDGHYTIPKSGQRKRLRAKAIALRIIRALERYADSTSVEVLIEQMVRQRKESPQVPDHLLLQWTKQLWKRVKDLSDTSVPLPSFAHVKMCLLDPTFKLDYDLILYDEAQHSHARGVLVGDPHQAFYRWRGGLNTWHTLPADKIFRLSKSFRFGSQLANVANTLIAYQNEEESLKGTSVPGEIYRPLKSMEFFGGEKWTMLFRSNEELMRALIQLAVSSLTSSKAPPRIALKINGARGGDPLKLYYHAHDLATESPILRIRPYEHWHAKLGLYKTWDDFREETLESGMDVEEVELAWLVEMEDDLRDPTFREKLEAATACITENDKEADTVLGVTHQVKGLEWDNVALANDYVDCFGRRGTSITGFAAEEFNLLYVAAMRAKRAKRQLVLSRSLFRLCLLERGLHNFVLDETPSTCMLCYELAKPCIQYDTAFPSLDPSLPHDVPSLSPSFTPAFPSSDFITPPTSPRQVELDPSPTPTKKRPRSPSLPTPSSSPSKRPSTASHSRTPNSSGPADVPPPPSPPPKSSSTPRRSPSVSPAPPPPHFSEF